MFFVCVTRCAMGKHRARTKRGGKRTHSYKPENEAKRLRKSIEHNLEKLRKTAQQAAGPGDPTLKPGLGTSSQVKSLVPDCVYDGTTSNRRWDGATWSYRVRSPSPRNAADLGRAGSSSDRWTEQQRPRDADKEKEFSPVWDASDDDGGSGPDGGSDDENQ